MTDGRELLGPLRAAGDALSRAALSDEARRRIADRLAEAEAAPRRRPALLPVAAVVLAAGAALWIALARGTAPAGPDPTPTAAPAQAQAPSRAGAAGPFFAWEGSRCAADERARTLNVAGPCRVRVEPMGMSIASAAAVELVRTPDGVRLARGTAEFEVAHRDGGPPVRVWVSAGAIEVTGTRFTVEQRDGAGHVDLAEGAIRFRSAGGTVTAVKPGTRFAWVDPPASPANDVPGPRPARATTAGPDPRPAALRDPVSGRAAAHAIERVQALRAERRYREAAELLRRLRAVDWGRPTAEVLSFEEGDLLERLGDERAACAHWRAHLARFPSSPYRAAIDRARGRLRCPAQSAPSGR